MSKNIFEVFDESDIKSVTALITKLGESSFDFLKLESDGVKIVIGKNGMAEVIEVSPAKAEAPSKANGGNGANGAVAADTQLAEKNGKADTATEPEVVNNASPAKDIQEQDGIVLIKAPTPGLFYAQPEPGAPPYVKVGDKVKEDTIVGLLEIMKVFNGIAAGVEGEITQIHIENAQLVEPGQPLMSVKVK